MYLKTGEKLSKQFKMKENYILKTIKKTVTENQGKNTLGKSNRVILLLFMVLLNFYK